MEANELHGIGFRAEAASHLHRTRTAGSGWVTCYDPNCPKMARNGGVDRKATGSFRGRCQKRTIPFVYRPCIKNSTKENSDQLSATLSRRYARQHYAQAGAGYALRGSDYSLGFVSKQGTLTITVHRSVVQD